ncbi:hypothetical protein [Lysinibacillus yapensis]|nr:hypothetical protein [Lysinibacillus yapensis]
MHTKIGLYAVADNDLDADDTTASAVSKEIIPIEFPRQVLNLQTQ